MLFGDFYRDQGKYWIASLTQVLQLGHFLNCHPSNVTGALRRVID